MSFIRLSGISKSYPDGENRLNHVLQGVDLNVVQGGFIAVKGSSGSGKTTLLEIMGTLRMPDSGAYLLNAQKAKVLLKMTYGPDGTSPVTDAEYTDYVNNDCYYIEAVQFPLVNYSTYSMADDDQKAAIMATAESCMAELNETATAETASSSALYTAAMTYVPEAMAAMGSTMDASQAVYYAASQLYTPSDLSSYGSDEYNNLTDPLDAAGMNHWTTIDLGTTVLVARKIDPFKTYTVEDLDSMYDLLTSMKSDAIQDELYAAGAALDHNLNSAAMNTYSASKIKKNV